MIKEVVFADRNKINTKNKTIGLTYSKGNWASNNANFNDKLGTKEMDQDNANTIEVPLKGGLISYNITDIKGVEVMHYFKRKYEKNHPTQIDVIDKEGSKDSYKLKMDNNEERTFINRFIRKIEYVIKEWMKKNKKNDIPYSKISILPVSSTSNFNKNFVKEELLKLNINGLKCEVVDPDIIVKNLENLQRDEDFIENNREFYDSNYVKTNPENGTVNQHIDDIISKNKPLLQVDSYINEINKTVSVLLNFIYNNKNIEKLTPLKIERLKKYYKKYVDLIRRCYAITYYSSIDGKEHHFQHEQILNMIKYSKGISIDNRSKLLWDMVKPYLRSEKSQVDNKSYEKMPLCYWKKHDFEIKKIRNSERLGLKNIYNLNNNLDEKKRNEEIAKMKGGILLIFDDNISGGATLSDVCLQCKNLGAENIIPITFGKMTESNTMGGLKLNTPSDGYNFGTNKNLSLYNSTKKEKVQNVRKNEHLNDNKKIFDKTFNIDVNLQTLKILWLDDIREPYSYFYKKKTSGAYLRNYNYYTNNIFNRYNPEFIWVKNLNEFKNYIRNNGLPDMISLDHDIKPRNYQGEFETGADVAQWLVNYCKENNLKMPLSISHSANEKGYQRIINILSSYKNNMYENKQVIRITESQLRTVIKESIASVIKQIS